MITMITTNDRVIISAAAYQEWLTTQPLPKDPTEKAKLTDDWGWMAHTYTVRSIKGDRAVVKAESSPTTRAIPVNCLIKFEPTSDSTISPQLLTNQPYSIGQIVDAMGCRMEITVVHEAGNSFEYELEPVDRHGFYWKCDRWSHESLETF